MDDGRGWTNELHIFNTANMQSKSDVEISTRNFNRSLLFFIEHDNLVFFPSGKIF